MVTTSSSTTTTITTPTVTASTTSTLVDQGADPFPQSALLGSWLLRSGYVITFGEDGRWAIADPDTPEDPFDFGAYDIQVATLIVTTDEDVTEGCRPGETGYFELSPPGDGGKIEVEAIEDACSTRRGDFSFGLTPYES